MTGNSVTENAESKRSHFQVVGCLVPTNNRKAFRVLCEVDGKQVLLGLVRKEDLTRSLESKPMLVVEISRFVCRPSKTKPRVSNGESCDKPAES